MLLESVSEYNKAKPGPASRADNKERSLYAQAPLGLSDINTVYASRCKPAPT